MFYPLNLTLNLTLTITLTQTLYRGGGGGCRGGFFLTPCPSLQTRLDDNEFAAGVFVDLKTAFDTVDHQILIAKPLQRTGFVLI